VEEIQDQGAPAATSKWLDPECGEFGCQSLKWKFLYGKASQGADVKSDIEQIAIWLGTQLYGAPDIIPPDYMDELRDRARTFPDLATANPLHSESN